MPDENHKEPTNVATFGYGVWRVRTDWEDTMHKINQIEQAWEEIETDILNPYNRGDGLLLLFAAACGLLAWWL